MQEFEQGHRMGPGYSLMSQTQKYERTQFLLFTSLRLSPVNLKDQDLEGREGRNVN